MTTFKGILPYNFCFDIVILLGKVMQKSPLRYRNIIFQSKVIPLFLQKCSNFHHPEMYTIMEYIPYLLWVTLYIFYLVW